jgi:DNA-directed RNA polymerase specialized sigma24 family protein
VSIDRLDAETRYAREPSHELTAERVFERQWALTLLARVLERLEAESGKTALFGRLRPALQGEDLAESYAAIGGELRMSDGAVRVAAHRLRARYRELLRDEVGRTTEDPKSVSEEIAELMAALALHD